MAAHDRDMPVIRRRIDAPMDGVWDVLCDGWLYPLWVVGTARMRAVDADWPAVGSRLHRSVGNWPLLLDDRTEVLDMEPGRVLQLRAHAWPAGAAHVVIELTASEDGSTEVSLHEDAARGPAVLVPPPLRHALVVPRNRESLRRLAYLAEGRAKG